MTPLGEVEKFFTSNAGRIRLPYPTVFMEYFYSLDFRFQVQTSIMHRGSFYPKNYKFYTNYEVSY